MIRKLIEVPATEKLWVVKQDGATVQLTAKVIRSDLFGAITQQVAPKGIYSDLYTIDPGVRRMLLHDDYIGGGITTTQLALSPRQRLISKRHWLETVEDVSDLTHRTLGRAIHHMLQLTADPLALVEERLGMDVGSWRLTGQFDRWTPNAEIADYKSAGLFAFQKGVKHDWIAQQNVNAHLCRLAGLPVESAKVVIFIRDWFKSNVGKVKDYPPCSWVTLPVPLWGDDEVLDYIHKRVELHRSHEDTPDDDLPDCTGGPDGGQRWLRDEKWAVMGSKPKARRLLDTPELAEEWRVKQTNRSTLRVEHRPGTNVRCAGYCRAAPWCSQCAALGVERETVGRIAA